MFSTAMSRKDTCASFATTLSSFPPMLPTMYAGGTYSGAPTSRSSTFAVFASTICLTWSATRKYRSDGVAFAIPWCGRLKL